LVRVKGVNSIVDHGNGTLLCRIEGEQGVNQRPGWVVREVRVVGFNKVPGLKKPEKMRLR
jgi:hypothetical protein